MGAVHDCTSATCGFSSTDCCPLSSSTCDADGEYIMNPSSTAGMTRFSACTIGSVCSRLGSREVNTGCLVDSRTGNDTGSISQCGNGIVEPGEACDCGRDACNTQDANCCDSLTCQWKGGAQCKRDDPSRGSNDGGNDSLSWWSAHHRDLIIGLAVGVGGSVLLIVFVCMVTSFKRSKRRGISVSKVESSG